MKNYRHGDLALVGINKLPKGLKLNKSKILMTGSHGHNHTFDNGKFYKNEGDDFVFGYLVSNNTKLYHPEHGKKVKLNTLLEAKINDGIYELRKQVEYTNEGMKQVID